MATSIRVSGSRRVVPSGSTQFSTQNGEISLNAPSVSVGGTLTINGDTRILQNSEVGGKLVVNTTLGDSTQNNTFVSIKRDQTANVDNPYGNLYNPSSVYGQGVLGSAAANAQRESGAVFIPGGLGIQKDLNVGGFIYGRIAESMTSTSLTVFANNEDVNFFPVFTRTLATGPISGSEFYGDNTGIVDGLRYNPYTGKLSVEKVNVASTATATSTDTGALTVAGGVGIGGELFVDDIITKVISSVQSKIRISPQPEIGQDLGLMELFGDIRVHGQQPIGTAPTVTNTLYVTMDGDDTNDGRAQDPSRACRTVTGAMNSPYYQPGTQILVSAGHYLEDNPLPMKPYTSVRGSDIRTTFIEPINKTQDLFHMNSGCYLNYMTFLNGRSGRLAGAYDQKYNRGAYCASFPPLEGEDRIDLFQSPYIQNCTNQSGPWLKDGVMFIPNSTVQVPQAVGIATWDAGDTTLVVRSDDTITIGQRISSGQQNPGFFNARTLLLANKPFIQAQTVAWVDATFNSGNFVYNKSKCSRDTGLIVASVAQDMLQDSTSNSKFSGIQYWNQGSYTGQITSEITATITAINHLKSVAVSYANSAGGSSPASIVSDRFDTILNILSNGTAGITDVIEVNGLPSSNSNTIAAYNALVNNAGTIADNLITYVNTSIPGVNFTYDKAKCSRDTGLIVDALVQDLLHVGRTQSTFAGIQYWSQSDYTGNIGSELTTTTSAISHIKDIAKKIVVNDTTGFRYSTDVQTVNLAAPGSSSEVSKIDSEFSTILTILNDGVAGVTDLIVPNGITVSTTTSVVNAYNLLQSNKSYLKSEAIAFVNQTATPGFTYDQAKCARDVDYMIDSVSFDLLYGGNKQAIQSGVYYYGYSDVTEIPNEVVETTAAYNHIKYMVEHIVQGKAVPVTYQSAQTQQITGFIPGTVQEVLRVQSDIDYLIGIINNGPSAAGEKRPISLQSTDNVDIQNAATILFNNKNFIKAEVIAFIDATFTKNYDQEKCRRDAEYILKSVAYDLLHGGNYQSCKSGVYYYSYGNTNTLTASNEVAVTTAAYGFIKSLVADIVVGKTIARKYQITVPQVTNLSPGTSYEVDTLQRNIDTIINIVRNGPDDAGIKEPINLTQNESTNVLNAYNMLIANIPFIQAETVAFIDSTMNVFDYNKQLCYRDAGIIIENMAYDMAFGGNQKSIESGKAYYRGVTSLIPGQESQTTGAINYIKELSNKIVVNQTCPVLSVPTGITAASQVFNTNFTDGDIVIPAMEELFSITTNIIENGPDSAPAVFDNSPGPDAAFVSAEVLLQANRTFIQENTLNYINEVLCYPPKTLKYNAIKCKRDAGIIVDSVISDLVFATPKNSQSTFAGLQYYVQNRYTGAIKEQLGPTIDAIRYLRDLSVKVVQNITADNDALLGIDRYTNGIQITATNYASQTEIVKIKEEFSNILTILNGKIDGWTDSIVPNGREPSEFESVHNTVDLMLANVDYLADEIVAFVNANNSGYSYSTSTCARDVGYIIESIAFDLMYGGNRQSIQSGLSYYTNYGNETVVPGEVTATIDAFTFIGTLTSTLVTGGSYTPRQHKVKPVLGLSTATSLEAQKLVSIVNTITNILSNGISGVVLTPISMDSTTSTTALNAYDIISANRSFIQAETVAYLDQTYNPDSFSYDQELCFRDTGLIVDAVSQDILLGGNQKSVEAGVSYWNQGYNQVAGQVSTTTAAINYVRDISLQIIANKPVEVITGTVAKQVINPFYQYGGDYMPQEAISRNFHIINTIIEKGVNFAPPVYLGGGLYTLTGPNGSSARPSPEVTSVTQTSPGEYIVGIDQPAIGYGRNATLYFGETLVFPLQDKQVEEKSLLYTGNANTWDQRKVDPIGAMGGALIDGAVISDKSPIQSFVFDAFTQLNQGGFGVKITNNGYAQLVSVFTIFCSVGVQCDNGGIASITNSNCNFGDISLLAKGYGPRSFSGTVVNQSYRAYPFSPNVPGQPYLDQFYPNGYWPNQGGRMLAFVPDDANRPHIGQVMEVVPPEGHINEQGFPGFLNTYPSTSTLSTGTITLTGINTTDVFIGNTVYIRDQFGSQKDENGVWYVDPGTVVTDVGYNSISLNQALRSGGGDPTNPTYFTLYFCGNSYYTVQTSQPAENPYVTGANILSANSNPYFEGPAISQISAHIQSISHMKSVVSSVVSNVSITPNDGNTTEQKLLSISGQTSIPFIELRFDYMINIIGATDITAAKAVVPQSQITTSGSTPSDAGNAITLIQLNMDFIADEVAAYVIENFGPSIGNFNSVKCARDVKLILQQLIYDLQTGGNYNSVYSGLSYWSRPGTYHIVELGEAVTRPDLFPDGAVLNFYQRSYISASGYLFEYVGAGTNYGALPQRGVADPVQSKETVQLNAGKVFFTSTDQNGDFRIGPGLVISQATGVLSGRTFVQSLYANMTPFILAIQ